MSAATLNIIRKACLKVAAAETSCFPEHYDKSISPLHGHCSAVATVVQACLGGEIVSGRVNGVAHYWSRLPDGSEVDLTSCQFGGNGMTPLKKGRKVKPRKLTAMRFLVFADKVRVAMGEEE